MLVLCLPISSLLIELNYCLHCSSFDMQSTSSLQITKLQSIQVHKVNVARCIHIMNSKKKLDLRNVFFTSLEETLLFVFVN